MREITRINECFGSFLEPSSAQKLIDMYITFSELNHINRKSQIKNCRGIKYENRLQKGQTSKNPNRPSQIFIVF